jgi:hypothetical protein
MIHQEGVLKVLDTLFFGIECESTCDPASVSFIEYIDVSLGLKASLSSFDLIPLTPFMDNCTPKCVSRPAI